MRLPSKKRALSSLNVVAYCAAVVTPLFLPHRETTPMPFGQPIMATDLSGGLYGCAHIACRNSGKTLFFATFLHFLHPQCTKNASRMHAFAQKSDIRA